MARKGVVYCATCDAPLFKDRSVAVIGGGNSALSATIELIPIAQKIYLITINPELYGEGIRKKKIFESKKIEVVYNAHTKEILGDKFVTGIKVDIDGKEKDIDVSGIFIEIGWETDVSFLPKEIKLNKWKEIIVDKENQTNIKGLFAAGDVTDIPYKQDIIAAGEGAKAALAVFDYLTRK